MPNGVRQRSPLRLRLSPGRHAASRVRKTRAQFCHAASAPPPLLMLAAAAAICLRSRSAAAPPSANSRRTRHARSRRSRETPSVRLRHRLRHRPRRRQYRRSADMSGRRRSEACRSGFAGLQRLATVRRERTAAPSELKPPACDRCHGRLFCRRLFRVTRNSWFSVARWRAVPPACPPAVTREPCCHTVLSWSFCEIREQRFITRDIRKSSKMPRFRRAPELRDSAALREEGAHRWRRLMRCCRYAHRKSNAAFDACRQTRVPADENIAAPENVA